MITFQNAQRNYREKFGTVLKNWKNWIDEVQKKKKSNQDTTSLEKEIDVLVYHLYELTYDEVKIIDKDFWLSDEEYRKIKIS